MNTSIPCAASKSPLPLWSRILLSLSSLSFWFLFSPAIAADLGYAALLAIFSSFVLWKADAKRPNAGLVILSGALAAALSFVICRHFPEKWNESSLFSRLGEALSMEIASLLSVFGISLGIAAWPFLFYSLSRGYLTIADGLSALRSSHASSSPAHPSASGRFKRALAIIINLCASVAFAAGSMLAVYAMPTAPVEAHVAESAVVFLEEGDYPTIVPWAQSQLDNFTDAIMLLEASNRSPTSLAERAFLNYRGHIDGMTPESVIVEHYLNGIAYDANVSYPRYWHGFLVFVKPLLEIVDYQALRSVNGCAQLLLMLFAGVLLVYKKEAALLPPFVLAYLMLMPLALARSLQYSACFYIALIASTLLLFAKSDDANLFIFLNAGIATAFFDFLTYPIATVGIPAAVCLFIHAEDPPARRTKRALHLGLCWGIGYAAMWASKWIVASLFSDVNIIADALQTVIARTSHASFDGSVHYSLVSCISDNFFTFIRTPATFLTLLYCAALIARYEPERSGSHARASALLPYIALSLLPMLWYVFATNHSSVHPFFTNKAMVVSAFALMCGLTEMQRTARLRQSS